MSTDLKSNNKICISKRGSGYSCKGIKINSIKSQNLKTLQKVAQEEVNIRSDKRKN